MSFSQNQGSSSPPASQSTKDFPPLPGSHVPQYQPPVQARPAAQPQPTPQPAASAGWDPEMDYQYGLRGLIDRSRMQSPDALLTCGTNPSPLFDEQQRFVHIYTPTFSLYFTL